MAYVPPSGGNIVVEISTAQGYVPPSATAINVDLAVASFLTTTIIFLFLIFPAIFFYVQTGHSF